MQDIQLPPFPGAVEKQAQGTIFFFISEVEGNYIHLPAVPQSRRHTLNRATISTNPPCRVTSLSFLLISRRPPSIHSCKGRHVRRAGSHSVRKPPEVRKYPFPTASIHRHGRSATPPSGKHPPPHGTGELGHASLCKKPDGSHLRGCQQARSGRDIKRIPMPMQNGHPLQITERGQTPRPPSGIRFPTLFPWPFRDKRGCRGHGPSFELRGIRPAKAADFPDACGPNPFRLQIGIRFRIPHPYGTAQHHAQVSLQPFPDGRTGSAARMYRVRKPLFLKRGSSVPRSSKATWRRARQVRDAERLLMATEDEPQQGI